MQHSHLLMHNTIWDNPNLQKFLRFFFTFSIKRIYNISFSSNLWIGSKAVLTGKDTLAHLLLKFRQGKQKKKSQEAEKLGNLEGNALFSQLNLNPTKPLDNVQALCVPAFYFSTWGSGWGAHKPADYFYFSPGKWSWARGKFEVNDGCMLV